MNGGDRRRHRRRSGAIDPANAAAYAANAAAFATEMDALTAEVGGKLAPLHGQHFIVFHDAYQYFEDRFGLPAAGSIALTDAEAPRAPRRRDPRRGSPPRTSPASSPSRSLSPSSSRP